MKTTYPKKTKTIDTLPPPPPPGSKRAVLVPIDLLHAYMEKHGLEFEKAYGINTVICRRKIKNPEIK